MKPTSQWTDWQLALESAHIGCNNAEMYLGSLDNGISLLHDLLCEMRHKLADQPNKRCLNVSDLNKAIFVVDGLRDKSCLIEDEIADEDGTRQAAFDKHIVPLR